MLEYVDDLINITEDDFERVKEIFKEKFPKLTSISEEEILKLSLLVDIADKTRKTNKLLKDIKNQMYENQRNSD